MIIWSLAIFYAALGTFLVWVGADRIAQSMYDLAQKISHLRFGWLILAGMIVVISFPPCIGHTTIITLCGFAYGMKGFYIGAPASVVGSAAAFVALRFLFAKRLKRWSSSNEKWQALETVVRAKGLPLIFLIRASPFPPWVYSNSLFASIEAVSLWQFVVATTAVFPKVAVHTFIGSKLASLSDGETRRQMDTQTKILNSCLVVVGLLVAVLTSWVIYRSMQAHLRKLDGISPEVDELAAEAVEEAIEGAPLLRDYEDEDEERPGAIRLDRSRSRSPAV
ncbi:hypothetical protein NM688_g8019 [Phlebia brevispora]|uniref:Uncharacterized protein n=1 Tax=Phlebia brevispora TaxID=194682 RepID=A0ACC1RYH4_9APHY|nr:hypothetical protein NM688_g8019 [Phlebia brevispora]